MVSGVSVHSWLGLLFFEAYSKAEHCGPWEAQGRGNCSSHGNKKAKREEVEGPGFQKPLQVCAPNDFPSTRPYLLKVSPPFNNATGWGPSLLVYQPLGSILDPNYILCLQVITSNTIL